MEQKKEAKVTPQLLAKNLLILIRLLFGSFKIITDRFTNSTMLLHLHMDWLLSPFYRID